MAQSAFVALSLWSSKMVEELLLPIPPHTTNTPISSEIPVNSNFTSTATLTSQPNLYPLTTRKKIVPIYSQYQAGTRPQRSGSSSTWYEWLVKQRQLAGGFTRTSRHPGNQHNPQYPLCTGARVLLAHILVHLGEMETARHTIQSCIRLEPTLPEAHLLAAQIAFHQERYSSASQSLEQVFGASSGSIWMTLTGLAGLVRLPAVGYEVVYHIKQTRHSGNVVSTSLGVNVEGPNTVWFPFFFFSSC